MDEPNKMRSSKGLGEKSVKNSVPRLGREGAIERINRILDLIPIITGGRYLIEDLAHQYGVEPFQIQRDLEIAFICGLPGYTPDILIDLSLEDGYIEIFDPLVLDKPRAISFQDITAISLGLEILKSGSKLLNINQRLIDNLYHKLKSSLSPSSMVNILDEETGEKLSFINRSVTEKRVISFNYIDSAGRSSSARKVFPLNHSWQRSIAMLEGFDLEKREKRIFHTSRISQLTLGEIYEFSEDLSPPANRSHLIKVKINLSEKWWLLRFSEFINGPIEVDFDTIIFTVEFWDRQWLIKMLAPVSKEIFFLDLDEKESQELKGDIRQYLRRIKP